MNNLNKFFKKNKKQPIDKFFQQILYNKKFGYYEKKNPFGKKGDFITSPSVSFLFSEIIAIWIISVWESLGRPRDFNIVELGPGSGQMCKVMISAFKNFPDFFKSLKIFLYEKSHTLKLLQKKNIKEKKLRWISNFNQIKKGPVIFFGNEFFDAIPIKQLELRNKKLFERFVEIKNNRNFNITLQKVNKNLKNKINKYKTLKNNSFIEFPEIGLKELDKIVDKIKSLSGGILLIDYGYIYPKNISTIQSIKSHKKNHMFKNLSNADVTSLVNFRLLEEFFKKRQINVEKIVTQSFFLQKMGILERAEIVSKNMNFKDKSDLYLRVKRLLSQNIMGELFKVIFAGKLDKKILGFE